MGYITWEGLFYHKRKGDTTWEGLFYHRRKGYTTWEGLFHPWEGSQTNGGYIQHGKDCSMFYKRKGYTTWEGLFYVLSQTKGIYNMGRIVLSQTNEGYTKAIYNMGRIVL